MTNDVHIATKNRFLVTLARVHFPDTSSKIVLDRKLMPAWRPSVSTTFPVPSRKQVFFFTRAEHLPNMKMKERNTNYSRNHPTAALISFLQL